MIYQTERSENYVKYTFHQTKTKITNVEFKLYGDDHVNEAVVITLENGAIISLGHKQNCCEEVTLADGLNELKDLAWSELQYIEITSEMREGDEHSFVKIQTNRDSANLRWVGYSMNYSTEVEMYVDKSNIPENIKSEMNSLIIG